jgi:hypothetical protein
LNGVLKQTGNPAPHAKTPVEDLIAMGAKHPECQYKWGMAASFFLLGEIMIEKKHFRQAKDFLEEGLEIQLHLEHPDVQRTKDLLQTVSSIDD